jgi:hypothetical protein
VQQLPCTLTEGPFGRASRAASESPVWEPFFEVFGRAPAKIKRTKERREIEGKKKKRYYGHFILLSTLHNHEKLFCQTFS